MENTFDYTEVKTKLNIKEISKLGFGNVYELRIDEKDGIIRLDSKELYDAPTG